MFRCLAVLCAALAAMPAVAQDDRRPSHCIAIADATPGMQYLHKASWTEPVPEQSVRINYIDHASFLIQTEDGLSAVTDYTGYLGQTDHVPDVATMNHAHSSHWTAQPDERIPNVLKGWGNGYEPNEHWLDLGGMLIRNVPTDIRSAYSEGTEKYGNSIFVFETAGLCIGHLGHLHHEPDEMQYASLGRLDVVMAAVDGGLTVSQDTMKDILNRLKSSVVIPMHWFGQSNLDRFLAGMEDTFEIDRRAGSAMEVSLRTLPDRPTIVVLQPQYLSDN
ncbi:L-ascorbate metabolism protein UlaG, beta-lactamase superfamily [Tranquillimonas rosea]|uniref:L-ascorbate metabolism protein UlaG, beta-lactamase superfamily n=1 Tax=Tranquillimonas rosea TaxID=641238 RepID=A0A1H9UWS4_9RHOB|nr:MBL fold metallo-hydrolase [Tranquillimonas rosea]SES14000.1 L-ascorbate metabolism protein UlaG, beta-lactamase superfamily [Tranquillimonas rosea]